jgi:hypothetical protein
MGSKWIFGRLAGRMWSRFTWLMIGTGGGSCEHGDEPFSSGATELVISLPYIPYKTILLCLRERIYETYVTLKHILPAVDKATYCLSQLNFRSQT